ncbi:MAG: hydantoinase/oxoprolinase family protein [Alphaproteobacteria bacterium]|nr:hydantoinase/oxoprolinase family protein [Alphaproteobacteria bacterium]
MCLDIPHALLRKKFPVSVRREFADRRRIAREGTLGYSACIDIGGTFTDLVVHEHGKGLRIFKSPSTPGEFERGFIDVLALAAGHYGHPLRAFLGNLDRLVHGTTVSTNALVEGKVAAVGLICNQGHPDVLTLREAPRKRAFNWKLDFPEPFVPRNRTFEVQGRIDSLGNEVTPLSDKDVRDAVAYLKRCEVQAIAVCLLWSIVNGAHERRVKEIVAAEWPGIPVVISHELNPIPREYRRTISTAIDASLHPIVSAYTGKLEATLRKEGFTNELLIGTCVGGMMPPDEIVRRPIYSVMSGPTLAPIAALNLTKEPDVIVIDMGGTTFDVSAIRDRQLVVTPEAMIGQDMLGIPKVDVRSIGAGGGSIAWVDVGGLLKVGPRSAGARPGPACYGTGGTEPTVTDSNVVLGIIDPDYFLGGRMKLNRGAAERAVRKIADQLGIGLVEAAYAIHTTSNHNMIAAIEDITVNEGIDPRDSYLVSGGGATACHIGEMVNILGLKRFMVPTFAAGLSAYGGLISDVRWEETATLHSDNRAFAVDRVNALVRDLKVRGDAFLARSRIPASKRRYEFSFQGRYEYQSWEIEVPFAFPPRGLKKGDVAKLAASFHLMHERIYTIKDEGEVVEMTTWKVRAIGDIGGAGRQGTQRKAQRTPAKPKSRRKVYIRAKGGMVSLPVFDGGAFGSGVKIAGPAVVEEETTTFLLLPGQTARTDKFGNYLVVCR